MLTPLQLARLMEPHRFRDSVMWRLSQTGILIGNAEAPETFGGEPVTVRRIWNLYAPAIQAWAGHFETPVELIVATICTETTGNPQVVRQEPGFVSDEATPHRVSVGLMQTLISTARSMVPKTPPVDRPWLLVSAHAIQAGTAYIASQRGATGFDPPKVACAYNAGGIYYDKSPYNRWKMRQYPLGTGKHADRFVKWFNECFLMFQKDGMRPLPSFWDMLHPVT